MNAEEAQHLLALVSDQYGDDAAYRYRIGNGDYVVRLCLGDEDYWLWSFEDWSQYRRAEKAAARKLALEAARARSKRKGNKQLLEVAV